MSKPNIYLFGKMSGLSLEEMNGWRLQAKDILKDNFNVINPCDYYNFEIDADTYTDHEVKAFDLYMCKNSKILLGNLEHPDTIGSAIEMHMSHDEWGIPVVAYGGEYKKVHPWMRLSITKWCKTLEEAVQYINEFYLPNL